MSKKTLYSYSPIVKPNIYSLMFQSNEVVEVRALGIKGKNKLWGNEYTNGVVFGYFDNPDKMLKAIYALDRLKPHGVYFTLNPVKKDLLARANNRLKAGGRSSSTKDSEVECVRWLPIDIDPIRPAGISSSNEELAYALDVQEDIVLWLKEEFDIDAGILAMSGNGIHVLVRIEDTEPEVAAPLIKKALKAIAQKFGREDVNSNVEVDIDQSVFNPARIWKAYGTVARKGDHTKERPHRRAIVFDTGIKTLADIPVNPLNKIKALADVYVGGNYKKSFSVNNSDKNGASVDIQRFLENYQDKIEILDIKDLGDGIKMYRLAECIFAEEHTTKTSRGDSGFIVFPNGKVIYQCFHAHCQDKIVYDALKKIAGGDYKKYIIRKNKKEQNNNNGDDEELILKPITEYKAEQVEWLWYPYLPKGKITLLEGDPGCGKTWLSLYICYKLVRENKPIVFCTAEDGIADTIKNRLKIIAEGDNINPDLSKFYILEGVKKGDESVGLFTLDNLNPLEKAIKNINPALIVLDPIQGFLGGKIDINRANEVREKLKGLVKLGDEYGCSFILVRHLAKINTNKAIYKGLGSIDFSAIARSILLVGQKDKQIILTQHKNSLGETGKSLAFEIKDGMFLYAGEINIDSEDILDQESSKSALEEAKEFLLAHLENNESGKPASFLFREAKKIGISRTTLKRAKKELNIKSERVREGGKFKEFVWKIPQKVSMARNIILLEPYKDKMGFFWDAFVSVPYTKEFEKELRRAGIKFKIEKD